MKWEVTAAFALIKSQEKYCLGAEYYLLLIHNNAHGHIELLIVDLHLKYFS